MHHAKKSGVQKRTTRNVTKEGREWCRTGKATLQMNNIKNWPNDWTVGRDSEEKRC